MPGAALLMSTVRKRKRAAEGMTPGRVKFADNPVSSQRMVQRYIGLSPSSVSDTPGRRLDFSDGSMNSSGGASSIMQSFAMHPEDHELGSLTIEVLRERCAEAGLPSTGTKAVLVDRLQAAAAAAPRKRSRLSVAEHRSPPSSAGSGTMLHGFSPEQPAAQGLLSTEFASPLSALMAAVDADASGMASDGSGPSPPRHSSSSSLPEPFADEEQADSDTWSSSSDATVPERPDEALLNYLPFNDGVVSFYLPRHKQLGLPDPPAVIEAHQILAAELAASQAPAPDHLAGTLHTGTQEFAWAGSPEQEPGTERAKAVKQAAQAVTPEQAEALQPASGELALADLASTATKPKGVSWGSPQTHEIDAGASMLASSMGVSGFARVQFAGNTPAPTSALRARRRRRYRPSLGGASGVNQFASALETMALAELQGGMPPSTGAPPAITDSAEEHNPVTHTRDQAAAAAAAAPAPVAATPALLPAPPTSAARKTASTPGLRRLGAGLLQSAFMPSASRAGAQASQAMTPASGAAAGTPARLPESARAETPELEEADDIKITSSPAAFTAHDATELKQKILAKLAGMAQQKKEPQAEELEAETEQLKAKMEAQAAAAAGQLPGLLPASRSAALPVVPSSSAAQSVPTLFGRAAPLAAAEPVVEVLEEAPAGAYYAVHSVSDDDDDESAPFSFSAPTELPGQPSAGDTQALLAASAGDDAESIHFTAPTEYGVSDEESDMSNVTEEVHFEFSQPTPAASWTNAPASELVAALRPTSATGQDGTEFSFSAPTMLA